MKRSLNSLQDIEKEKNRLRKLIQSDQAMLQTQLQQTTAQVPSYLFRRWLLPLGIGSLLTLGTKQLQSYTTATTSSPATWRSWAFDLLSPLLQQWLNEQIARWLPFMSDADEAEAE